MARKVICISHDTGAGGDQVGRLVADRLGLRLVDEEIVNRAAEKQGVSPDDLADVERRKSLLRRVLEEMARGGEADALTYMAYSGSAVDPLPATGSLRALIQQSIRETADEGHVVIVAHAASFALTGRDDVLRVLVTASRPTRTRRLADALEVDEKKAAKAIASSDAGRADYLKRFYGVGEEQPTHYDLVVNTDALTADRAADIVAHAAS